jgi:hypothetical protein
MQMAFDHAQIKARVEKMATSGVFIGTSSWKYPGCPTPYAQASGQSIASASFNIVGKLHPVIYLVDPTSSTSAGWPSGVNRGYSGAVRGEISWCQVKFELQLISLTNNL